MKKKQCDRFTEKTRNRPFLNYSLCLKSRKIKIKALYISLLCVISLCLPSCQPAKEKSKEQGSHQKISLSIHTDVTALDPRLSFLAPTLHILRMLFEGLTRLGPDGQPILALAEWYEVASDKKVYTFHLRKSVWSNGEPVTAHDFIYSWRGTLSPCNPSRTKAAFYPIKNVEAFNQGRCSIDEIGLRALDESTLQIELEYPYESLFQLLAYPAFSPLPQKMDEVDRHWTKQTGAHYVCNGPFYLQSRIDGHGLQLLKNPHYWDAAHIRLDEVSISIIPDIATQDALFQKGEIDFIGLPLADLPADTITRLEQDRQLKQIPSTDIFWCALNTRHPLLAHPKMRQALAIAVDRKEIVNHVLPQGFCEGQSILPRSLSQLCEPTFGDCDIARAQKLYHEALKETDSSPQTLTLLYSPKDLTEKVIQVLCNQWKKNLGLNIHLEAVELKTRLSRMKSGAFEIGAYTWFSWIHDPLYTLHNYRSNATLYNYTGWSHPSFTQFLDQFQTANDTKKRSDLIEHAEQLMMKELPLIPIYNGALTYAHNQSLQGVIVTPYYEFDLRWAYMSKIE